MLIDEECELDWVANDGAELAHAAAMNPNEEILDALIAAGVNLNARDNYGELPTLYAARNPNEKVLARLLEVGAEVGLATDGTSLFHAAARNRNDAVMMIVLAALGEADVTRRNSARLTPLLLAALRGTVAVVQLLLNAHANLDDRTVDNCGVCHRASQNENAGVMQLLIARGANFRARSAGSNGKTPFELAVEHDNLNALLALVDAGVVLADELAANPDLFRVAVANTSKSARVLRFFLRHFGLDAVVNKPLSTLSVVWRFFSRQCQRPWIFDKASSAGAMALFAFGVDVNECAWEDADMLLTIVAAGGDFKEVDSSGYCAAFRGDFSELEELALVAAVGGVCPPFDLPRVEWAQHRIRRRQVELLRWRAFEVCVGVHGLRVPALQQCEILAHAFAPRESLVPFHIVWKIVTTVKHF